MENPFEIFSSFENDMIKLYLIFGLILLAELTLLAQINESDTSRLQWQVRAGGSYQTGNIELLRIASQLDFSSRIKNGIVFKTQNNHLFQQIFGNKADEDLISRNYLYFQPQNIIYPYAIGYISTNFRREIKLRTFYGLGLTIHILRKPIQSIKLSTNLLQEKSKFSDEFFNYTEFDGNEEISAFWSTCYLSGFHALNKHSLQLVYELYWQQSLSDGFNYRYHIYTGFDQKLSGGLSIQSRLIYAFENLIMLGVRQNDLLWTWGLSYIFKSAET